MREDVHSIADQLSAVAADVLAMPDVFVRKFLCRCQREGLLLLDRLAGAHGLAHELDRVERIDGGGPRGFEGIANPFDVPQELRQVPSAKGARALGEAIGGSGANRARAAHDHVLDRSRRLAEVERRDHLEPVRQEPLLDEQNGVAPGVKRHRPEVAGAAVDGDVQAMSTFIFRILVSILR